MRRVIRSIKEGEISKVVKFLSSDEQLERKIFTQFHRQKDLVLISVDDQEIIEGVVVASGHGDTVSIDQISVLQGLPKELVKKLITFEEKVSRRYGYSKIFLSQPESQKNFLVALGYMPRLLFTFSERRKDFFELFSTLYPLWIEAGGEQVKVILGGDHLEEDIKLKLKDLPVKTDLLFVKNL